MEPVFNKIKQESKTLNMEFRARTLSFIVGGLGLVAALAWNDAVRALIDYILPIERDGVLAKFLYAFILSVIVVFFSIYLVRLFTSKEQKEDSKKK